MSPERQYNKMAASHGPVHKLDSRILDKTESKFSSVLMYEGIYSVCRGSTELQREEICFKNLSM